MKSATFSSTFVSRYLLVGKNAHFHSSSAGKKSDFHSFVVGSWHDSDCSLSGRSNGFQSESGRKHTDSDSDNAMSLSGYVTRSHV